VNAEFACEASESFAIVRSATPPRSCLLTTSRFVKGPDQNKHYFIETDVTRSLRLLF
jgi:hypothetical protein